MQLVEPAETEKTVSVGKSEQQKEQKDLPGEKPH
jgi:hypothetical protein